MTARKALFAATVAAAALAGCSKEGDIVVEQGVGITALRSVCPAVGVPDFTGNVTLFNPRYPAFYDHFTVNYVINSSKTLHSTTNTPIPMRITTKPDSGICKLRNGCL